MDGDITILSSLADSSELIIFQLKIAERWYDRGNRISDIFAKFFFYFTGFNALYFLWKEIDNINGGEKKHIENLLRKFGIDKSINILDIIKSNIDYFIHRRPISRMDQRDSRTPNTGSLRDGINSKILLTKNNGPLAKIIAMGYILYFIRCNLVHGSKSTKKGGDDEEIISESIEPLKIFLEESIKITEYHLKKR